ncbi:hypothetical protein AB0B94_07635 [Micromonospora sp. NPDC048986]|uniref:hypothetical protein n=1 Tax=Micromonospora sp. NPDC048986 TaxID=3155644 RepID=UPI0033DF8801
MPFVVRSTAVVLMMLASCVGVAACTEQEPASDAAESNLTLTAPPAVPHITTLSTTDGLSLPLDAYALSEEKLQVVLQARALLIEKCLARFGFVYDFPVPVAQEDRNPLGRRYGITDRAVAAQWGYATAPRATPAVRPRRADDRNPALLLVLTGWPDGQVPANAERPSVKTASGADVPPGGCESEASRALVGEDEKYDTPEIVRQLDANAYHQSSADDRVVAVQKSWSECMKKEGYDFPNPLDAADRSTNPSSASSIRTALTDIDCKNQTNLIGVSFAVEVAYQSGLIQQNLERLKAVKDRLESEVQVAGKTVSGS